MSGVRAAQNVQELKEELARSAVRYDKLFAAEYQRIRSQAHSGAYAPDLEAHVREYRVNHVLAALGWRMDLTPEHGLPALVPEASVRSVASGHWRRMDYLGVERATDTPLLIVETKAPSQQLPTSSEDERENRAAIIDGLAGRRQLRTDWEDTLKQVSDYAQSVQQGGGRGVERLAISNGEWWIVICDPAALCSGQAPAPEDICVFANRDKLFERASELFGLLAFQRLVRRAPACFVTELLGRADVSQIDRAMHGVRLIHGEESWWTGHRPPSQRTVVYPVIYVGTPAGVWLRVDCSSAIVVNRSKLSEHLADVEAAAMELLREIEAAAGKQLPIKVLDDGAHAMMTLSPSASETVLATGRYRHYLSATVGATGCIFHDWSTASAANVAMTDPVLRDRYRAMFGSGDARHCAHRDVESKKRRPPYGGAVWTTEAHSAFCRLWAVDEALCCHACNFFANCHGTDAGSLPCLRV